MTGIFSNGKYVPCKYDKCRTHFHTVEEMDKHIEKMDKRCDRNFRWILKDNPSTSLKREDLKHAHGYRTDECREIFISKGFTMEESK
tara:strand:+ start:2504 stop:2764 length:261 start_codon:yes stop_codon:yes gene_type:complete